jgi:FkbM family methyltransferase
MDSMLRNGIRDHVARCLARLPRFRGKGRLTLLIDRFLTDSTDPASYRAITPLNGGVIRLDLRSFTERFIFYYRTFEPDLISTLKSFYRGGNFLDVGSNTGMYVVAFGAPVKAAGTRIFAIEPVPANLARLKENIEINGMSGLVEIAETAVGESNGIVRMDGDYADAAVNGVVSASGEREFPVFTLDTLTAERGWTDVRLMKIDVEGYEPAVLRGAGQFFDSNRPVILAEFNRERMRMNGFSMSESWDFLVSRGYRGYSLHGSTLRKLDSPGEIENLFFIPREQPLP